MLEQLKQQTLLVKILLIVGALAVFFIVADTVLPNEAPTPAEQQQMIDYKAEKVDGEVPPDAQPAKTKEAVNTQDTAQPNVDTIKEAQPVQKTAPTPQVSGSKGALNRLLNENANLAPTEIVSLYNALDARDRNWFEIETRFTHFMQLLACQEVPTFTTKDYMGNVYDCNAIAQSYAQSLQYSSEAELIGAADASRQSIMASLGCETGAIDRSVCDFGHQTQQNFQAGDRATFDSISDGFTSDQTCRVGIDPNCY